MVELKDLLKFAEAYKSEQLVLATIIETKGSTYSKAGVKKLIALNGDSCGVLSGGCLEAEINELAMRNPAHIHIQTIDTREESDRFFGSGIGCQGLLKILFEPVVWINTQLFSRTYLAYENQEEGVTLCFVNPESKNFGKRQTLSKKDLVESSLDCDTFQIPKIKAIESEDNFIEFWRSDLNVTIFGAGLDVEPLKKLIDCMGWQLNILEHRKEWLEMRILENWPIHFWDRNPKNIVSGPGGKKALLLMSHNYENDLNFLYHWIKHEIPSSYIGVLGPGKRKDQMITDMVDLYHMPLERIPQGVIHGPIGDKSFGRTSRAVALAIVSELQKEFYEQKAGNEGQETGSIAARKISV